MPSISRTVLTRASPQNRDIADIIWPVAVDPFRARAVSACCCELADLFQKSKSGLLVGCMWGLVRLRPAMPEGGAFDPFVERQF
jgi:hypothetical protein